VARSPELQTSTDPKSQVPAVDTKENKFQLSRTNPRDALHAVCPAVNKRMLKFEVKFSFFISLVNKLMCLRCYTVQLSSFVCYCVRRCA